MCRRYAIELKRALRPLILAEEALNSKSIPAIIETLEQQSSWSNLPITIVTSGGEATQSRLRRLGGLATRETSPFLSGRFARAHSLAPSKWL